MRENKKNSKKEFKGEKWEEWALTYGRNGSSERKNTSEQMRKVSAPIVFTAAPSAKMPTWL